MLTSDSTSAPRKCTRCGDVYPATREYFSKKDAGLSAICKPCERRKAKEYQSTHREENRIRAREWRETHLEEHREERRRYQKEHREQRKATGQRREARKLNLPDDFTTADWQDALDYFHGCCAVCGRQLNDLFGTHTAAADHWIPLASPDCPGTIPTNIVPLCHGQNGCNQRKKARHPMEFLMSEFGTREAHKINARIQVFFALRGKS